jgi:chemotaxis regulatin CheY-phosphate phosphatase CheZ
MTTNSNNKFNDSLSTLSNNLKYIPMSNIDLKQLGQKVGELKALFILGQRVIPFMEELFVFIEETSPLLDEINKAIKENLKKMPKATKQLSKVTQATETASTEIMDTVDRVNNGLYEVIQNLGKFKENQSLFLANPINLLQSVVDATKEKRDITPIVDEIQSFIERARSVIGNEHEGIINDIVDTLNSISDDANNIINSLQIQDITAQQLAAVNHLLESVQVRLTGIMNAFQNEESKSNKFDENIKISKLHRAIAFDPNAVDAIEHQEHRQTDIDDMMANPEQYICGDCFNNKKSDGGEGNEGEIDPDKIIASFQNQSVPPQQKAAEPEPEDENENEELSEDDIAALFG